MWKYPNMKFVKLINLDVYLMQAEICCSATKYTRYAATIS